MLARGGRLCINVANTDRKPYLSLVSLIDEQLRTSECTWLHRGHIIWDKGASAGISTAWGSFARSSNPTLRDVHEYISVWSKDQLRLDGGGPTGISGNEFVAWTRSIWRPEDGLKDLQRKIEAKLADRAAAEQGRCLDRRVDRPLRLGAGVGRERVDLVDDHGDRRGPPRPVP